MSRSHTDALTLSRKLLRLLVALNLAMGILILALLLATLVSPVWVMGALGVEPGDGNARQVMGMRLIMVLGTWAVIPGHIVLTRLLAIVNTVNDGDPFVAENAVRLKAIAWALAALEILHLGVGAVAAGASSATHPLDLDWSPSLTPWLAVLLLFVLARVFDQGARMRADLEGTV